MMDDLKTKMSEGASLSIAAASFSIYAFEALKKEFESIDELRFIFTSPTFVKDKIKTDITKNYHFLRTYTIPAFIWASIVFMSIPNRIIYSLIILLFSLSVIRLLL